MPLIIESLVTTRDAAGRPNVAPMGVEWEDGRIVLKPFLETTTFRNLATGGGAVVNFTDDVLLFARAALGAVTPPLVPAAHVAADVLADACSWHEVRVTHLDPTPPRARAATETVAQGRGREFLGFNRARFAVLEATILATRLHLLPRHEVEAELERHQALIDKTAGAREREAWAFVRAHVAAAPMAAAR